MNGVVPTLPRALGLVVTGVSEITRLVIVPMGVMSVRVLQVVRVLITVLVMVTVAVYWN